MPREPKIFSASIGLLALIISVSCSPSATPEASAVPTATVPAAIAPAAPLATPTSPPQAQPGPRPTPPFNPFANMTPQQTDCLRTAWGAPIFQEITTFVRAPSSQEEQAMVQCGVLQRPGQQPAGAPAGPPSPGSPGQPPAGAESVLKEMVYFTTSSDGLNWGTATLLAEKASVPEVIRTSKGTLWVYWVDFSAYTGRFTEKIRVARSSDGTTWEKLGTVKFNELGSIVPVDPDVIELPDGRLRMYFYDIRQQQGDHPIYSAVSSDGLNYALEPGIRFKAENIYDPDVIQLKDGSYRMYLNKEDIISASSSDGLTFTLDNGARVEKGAVPGSIVLPDGSIRLYACIKGMSAYRSADGLDFSLEKDRLILAGAGRGIICDPSVTATSTGYLLVYKYNPGQ